MKNHFNKFLSEKTQAVFDLVNKYSFIHNYTLVGGSGLAYYLNHRLSEDLDFFTWEENLRKQEIDKFLFDINKEHQIEILNQSQIEFDLLIDNCKLTFFANDWLALKSNRQRITENIYVGNVELLTAMKVNSLSMRAKFRDYYDLYVISKELFNMNVIFKIAKDKLPGLTKKIFAMQITYIEDIDDESIRHLNPKYEITLEEIHQYFEKQISLFLT